VELEYEFSGFRFAAGPDPSGPSGQSDVRRMAVRVFKDGQPSTDLHGAQFTKGFAPGVGAERLEAFCRRFAEDEAYRTRLLLKHAFACC